VLLQSAEVVNNPSGFATDKKSVPWSDLRKSRSFFWFFKRGKRSGLIELQKPLKSYAAQNVSDARREGA
jgi:hypothetical protein